MTEKTKIIIFRSLLLAILFCIGLFIWFTDTWKYYVNFIIYDVLVPLGIKKMSLFFSLPITFFAVYTPVILLGCLIGKIFRPYVNPSKELEHQINLEKLDDIKKLSSEVNTYVQTLQKEVDSLRKTYETLEDDVKLLAALKTDGLKTLKRSRFVFLRDKSTFEKIAIAAFSLVAGIIARAFKDYISEILKKILGV